MRAHGEGREGILALRENREQRNMRVSVAQDAGDTTFIKQGVGAFRCPCRNSPLSSSVTCEKTILYLILNRRRGHIRGLIDKAPI